MPSLERLNSQRQEGVLNASMFYLCVRVWTRQSLIEGICKTIRGSSSWLVPACLVACPNLHCSRDEKEKISNSLRQRKLFQKIRDGKKGAYLVPLHLRAYERVFTHARASGGDLWRNWNGKNLLLHFNTVLQHFYALILFELKLSWCRVYFGQMILHVYVINSSSLQTHSSGRNDLKHRFNVFPCMVYKDWFLLSLVLLYTPERMQHQRSKLAPACGCKVE